MFKFRDEDISYSFVLYNMQKVKYNFVFFFRFKLDIFIREYFYIY